MPLGRENRGLVKSGRNHAEVVGLPIPRLRDDYILVKTVAVALNPADWQNLDEEFESGTPPLLLGNDTAGVIEAVGDNVTQRLKKGDRVICCVHGVNVTYPEDGAFAHHIQARGDVSIRIPSHLSFTDAATLPGGLLTVALGLYKHLRLPLPPAKVATRPWILVYGGSSASGTLVIQFAKLSGLKVVTTCSPRNFGLVQDLGADAVFDYRDPDCARKIRELTTSSLSLVFDTIATPTTARICGDSMSPSPGGIYCNLMGVDAPRDDIETIFFLAYSGLGRPYMFEGKEWPLVPEDYDLAKRFAILAEDLLEQKLIRPHPASVRDGGLEAITTGIQDLREGRVSGEKLVYVLGNEKGEIKY